MEVKEAVRTAKTYLEDLFAEEAIQDLGLEEIEFEDTDVWKITLGFSRPWERSIFDTPKAARAYKVVAIDDGTGRILSVKERFPRDPR